MVEISGLKLSAIRFVKIVSGFGTIRNRPV